MRPNIRQVHLCDEFRCIVRHGTVATINLFMRRLERFVALIHSSRRIMEREFFVRRLSRHSCFTAEKNHRRRCHRREYFQDSSRLKDTRLAGDLNYIYDTRRALETRKFTRNDRPCGPVGFRVSHANRAAAVNERRRYPRASTISGPIVGPGTVMGVRSPFIDVSPISGKVGHGRHGPGARR